MSREIIRVSVRSFVEFLLRSGDIDNRRGNIRSQDAMLLGSRIHRKIQASMGPDYRSEVFLKIERAEEDYDFLLEGRADGIYTEDGNVIVDEIKGVFLEIKEMEEPIRVHIAQAKCYAYMYSQIYDLDEIYVQLTYCNMDTEEIVRFREGFKKEELLDWFNLLCEEFRKWMVFKRDARCERNKSIESLNFPYPYRDGQDQLVKDVYRSILRQKTLFIEAPTGVGKTISTIFPSVKAIGQGLGEQIFYLTAKTITRTAAEQCYQLLLNEGLKARVITITAKDKVCPLEERLCNPEDCPYSKGYYDRVNDAVYEFINQEGIYDRDTIKDYALSHDLCPFEFSLDLSLWCDGIICDYNYVFDPNVYLKRFFEDGIKGDYIFLVDEAHNMVDRGRDMYSAILYKEDFLTAKNVFKNYDKKIATRLDKANKMMLAYKRECDSYKIISEFNSFHFAMIGLMNALETFHKKNPRIDLGDFYSDFYLRLRHFVNMAEIMEDDYEVYTEHDSEGRFLIRLFCIETAKKLEQRITLSKSTVFFSATLLPVNYYKEMLTTNEDNYAVYAKTAFKPEQSRVFLATDVSSKYNRRNKSEYQRYADYILKTIESRAGNYMVFFPSYVFMRAVSEEFLTPKGYEMIVQDNNMSEEEREDFLNNFTEDSKILAFCVMGGIFSEGIDLKEDRLIGSIIVGTGLPQISNEREILKKHYDDHGKSGFDHAFRYPGMNKVMQAAGRVIRTERDRGVILLLDERFNHKENRELFPLEWKSIEKCTIETLSEQLRKFWEDDIIS